MAANDSTAQFRPVFDPETDSRFSMDLSHLREENRRLHADLARVMEERNRLLRKQVESGRGRSGGGSRVLEQRLGETRAEISELQKQRKEQDERLAFLAERMAETTPLPRLFLERLEGLARMARGEAGAGELLPDDLSAITDRFNAALEGLWRQLDSAGVAEQRSQRERLATLQGKVESQRRELAALHGRNDDLNRELKALELSLQQALADTGLRDSRLEDLGGRILDLEEENRSLSRANLKLKEQVRNLRGVVDPDMFSYVTDTGRTGGGLWERIGWGEGRHRAVVATLAAGLVAVGVLVGYLGLRSFPREGVVPQPEPSHAALPAAVDEAVDEPRPPVSAGGSADGGAAVVLEDPLGDGLVGPRMVSLAGGRFSLGTDRYAAPAIEKPARAARVGAFFMGRYEVTFAQYDAFARSTGRPLPPDQGWGRDRRPVVNVTWDDARAYADWLSRRTGHRYRLPTEAEWEYAMRGDSPSIYWWGNGASGGREVCLGCGTRWDGTRTAPVASASANPNGLYDMGGNVMEWTADCLVTEEGFTGQCATRVVRGGAFNKPEAAASNTARRGMEPGSGYATVGFRVVRER